jgi:hypothetical protein
MTNIRGDELASHINDLTGRLSNEKEEAVVASGKAGVGLDVILEGCRIHVSDTIPKPEGCLEIVSGPERTMIATLGNFSAIIGKAKSKKTFLISMAVSSAVKGHIIMQKFNSLLPEGKRRVLFFDTEQSRYHVQKVVRRICHLAEIPEPDNLECFALRPEETKRRIELIEHALETIEGVGLVVIDGIRDLVMDINDPSESTIIVTKLMQWTERKGIHVMTAIHQNKGDTNARGHLGTEIINKAETIISVTKDPQHSQISVVEPEYIREKEFPPFAIGVHDSTGVPFIHFDWQPPKPGKKNLSPADIPESTHFLVLGKVFERNGEPSYEETWRGVKLGFEEMKMGFGDNVAKHFLSYYSSKGWVAKRSEGRRSIYSLERKPDGTAGTLPPEEPDGSMDGLHDDDQPF